jgi:ribosomal protein L29
MEDSKKLLNKQLKILDKENFNNRFNKQQGQQHKHQSKFLKEIKKDLNTKTL